VVVRVPQIHCHLFVGLYRGGDAFLQQLDAATNSNRTSQRNDALCDDG
jgi:hypothetical protein